MKWKAKWIWPNDESFYYNTFVFFRKEIVLLPDQIKKAEAYIFADSRYKLFINEITVGYGPVPADRNHDCYDKYDIYQYLRSGKNTIGVIVCFFGNPGGNYIVGRPELIFQGEIIKNENEKEYVCTDDTWKCKFASCWGTGTARRSIWKPLTEIFDAGLYPEGWELSGYDDSRWMDAKVLLPEPRHAEDRFLQKDVENLYYRKTSMNAAKRAGRVEFYDNPMAIFRYMLREQVQEKNYSIAELLSGNDRGLSLPIAVREVPDNQCTYVVFDFGQEVVGRLGFKIRAEAGTIIDIVHRESEQQDKMLLSVMQARNWIRYTAKEGLQIWQTFDYDAFRYVQLAIHHSFRPVEILEVWVEEQGYPIKNQGEFQCSDMVLNRLWEASVHTASICMQDVIPDNPGREQAPWSGDIEFAKMPIYYIAGEYELTKRSLLQTSYGQVKSGKMKCLWPSGMAFEFFTNGLVMGGGSEIPHHSIQWISSIWRHYLYSGDREVLIRLLPSVKLLIKWLESHEDGDGLLCPGEDWDDRWDWVDWEGIKNLWVPLNFFYCGALYDAAKIASELNEEEGLNFRLKAEGLKNALIQKYWSEEYGSFVDCMGEEDGVKKPFFSELTLSLAINNNIHVEGKQKCIAERLKSGLEDCSPVHKYHPYQAYSMTGDYIKVLDEFRNKWSRMQSVNETNTMQEVWNGNSQPNYCLCQSAAAVPGYYLPAYILGVRPLKPGFKEFIIEPQTCDLIWAKGRVPTPYGFIYVGWEIVEGVLKLDVKTPEGYTKVGDDGEPGQFRYMRFR